MSSGRRWSGGIFTGNKVSPRYVVLQDLKQAMMRNDSKRLDQGWL